MGTESKFHQALTLSSVILVAGLLVSLGKTLSIVDQNTAAINKTVIEIKELRDYIEARSAGRYTASDSARDMAYIDKRLSRIESYIDGRAGQQ